MTMKSVFFTLLCTIAHPLSAYVYPHETPIIKYLIPIEITEASSGLTSVDCIYVINLDERAEKWKRMQQLLNERALKVNRVSAVNGWKISDEVCQELTGPYDKKMKKGQIGAILSHVSALKNAFEKGFDLIWIMEDDIDFKEDVSQLPDLLEQLTEIDPDWDVFYTDTDIISPFGKYKRPIGVGGVRPDQPPLSLSEFNERTIITNDIMKLGQRFGQHSYFISKKGIQKILNYFTHVYLWCNIDIDIHRIPTIRQYSAMRDIVGNWWN